MSSQQPLTHLLRDMGADVRDYHHLRELLDAQFKAALSHDSEQIEGLGRDIMTLVDTLDSRRQHREQLVRQLLPTHTQPDMALLFQSLSATARDAMQARWDTLEALVRDCKTRNAHNGYLMTQQHAMLRQVLHGEVEGIYAAA